jgi:alpha-1,3-mannosyl-glycoprotein beta-1,2-N-acetylglucosaminyltransferase
VIIESQCSVFFQDGAMESVKLKAKSFPGVDYLQHLEADPQMKSAREMIAYYKIARHYKFALSELFDVRGYEKVIILEDDMEIAPDFFDYFEATATVLDNDKSVVAVSSWNDNGQKQFVSDPDALYRSDFFPGLGWMLTKEFWDELSPKWPEAYWDDWLRLNSTRQGRQFIRPEVCRTFNFGEHGASMGQFYSQYLAPIKLNNVLVDWKSKDLGFLREENFDREFGALIAKAIPIPNREPEALRVLESFNEDVRLVYENQSHFEELARMFGVFEEWKDGIPRTSYKGVVVFRWKDAKRVFLIRPDSLEKLGLKA